jgi:hypothetical protein
MLVYAVNTLLITVFQNNIWDHATERPHLMRDNVPEAVIYEDRLACNVAMANSILAVALAYFWPVVAFLVLCFRPLMIFVVARKIMKPKKAQRKVEP